MVGLFLFENRDSDALIGANLIADKMKVIVH